MILGLILGMRLGVNRGTFHNTSEPPPMGDPTLDFSDSANSAWIAWMM